MQLLRELNYLKVLKGWYPLTKCGFMSDQNEEFMKHKVILIVIFALYLFDKICLTNLFTSLTKTFIIGQHKSLAIYKLLFRFSVIYRRSLSQFVCKLKLSTLHLEALKSLGQRTKERTNYKQCTLIGAAKTCNP